MQSRPHTSSSGPQHTTTNNPRRRAGRKPLAFDRKQPQWNNAAMSFKIPSLEEARKKKEANLSPPPQFTAGQKRPAAAAAAASAASAPAHAAPAPMRRVVNPYSKPGATPANPYAKSSSAASNASTSAPKASSSSTSSSRPASTSSSTGNARRWNRSTAEAYAIRGGGGGGGGSMNQSSRPLPPPPPDAEDNPYATFSQAFGDVEDTEHFRQEVEAIRGKGAGAGRDDRARAEQRAFDATAAAAAAENETGVNVSARDSHIALQPHVLHVSTKQRGNAVLNYIRNVPFAYSKMVPDYIFSPNRCALFLSCKYHNLHPNYIHRRISELRTDFDLRVLLLLVDVDDNAATLLFLNKLCVVNSMTLILAWSNEEAARYLETFKAFEGKDASSIQRREQTNFADQVSDVLCAVRSVNKTDSAQLMSQFGTLKGLMAAPMDELSLCPGIGEKKVRRLYEAFHKPFSSTSARKRRKEREQAAAAAKEKDDNDDSKKLAAPLEDDEEERFFHDNS